MRAGELRLGFVGRSVGSFHGAPHPTVVASGQPLGATEEPLSVAPLDLRLPRRAELRQPLGVPAQGHPGEVRGGFSLGDGFLIAANGAAEIRHE